MAAFYFLTKTWFWRFLVSSVGVVGRNSEFVVGELRRIGVRKIAEDVSWLGEIVPEDPPPDEPDDDVLKDLVDFAAGMRVSGSVGPAGDGVRCVAGATSRSSWASRRRS